MSFIIHIQYPRSALHESDMCPLNLLKATRQGEGNFLLDFKLQVKNYILKYPFMVEVFDSCVNEVSL